MSFSLLYTRINVSLKASSSLRISASLRHVSISSPTNASVEHIFILFLLKPQTVWSNLSGLIKCCQSVRPSPKTEELLMDSCAAGRSSSSIVFQTQKGEQKSWWSGRSFIRAVPTNVPWTLKSQIHKSGRSFRDHLFINISNSKAFPAPL